MRVLIDSHIYVWGMLNDPRLTTNARDVLDSEEHELFFSLASLWELSIKIRKGKLRTLTSSIAFLHDSLAANRVAVLPVRYEDILSLEQLDEHHKDPFDRIIVAQAVSHGLKVLTEDKEMKLYPVETIW